MISPMIFRSRTRPRFVVWTINAIAAKKPIPVVYQHWEEPLFEDEDEGDLVAATLRSDLQ